VRRSLVGFIVGPIWGKGAANPVTDERWLKRDHACAYHALRLHQRMPGCAGASLGSASFSAGNCDESGNVIVTVNPASLRTSISPLIC
jgi:hypothetical protein